MIPAGVKVFLASHPIDFRKGPDSLLSLVRDAGSDPFNGSLYVFRAKRADRVASSTSSTPQTAPGSPPRQWN
ncbi:IS66 family insertion sequence element accessory protein TnpB [Agrobacterium tumefaciens]|uniref:IS66 family insertion sequence element accessory protein TnpB n=1 Tax=Agrobacterium tumefaciens TaxID=358 RepID=UPI0021F96CC4|nr:transposase [Agrobacterium tumefaciens]